MRKTLWAIEPQKLNMSCVLRIESKNFNVIEFLKETKLESYQTYLKGDDLIKNHSKHAENGCKFDLSDAEFDRFDLQKKDAIEFLTKHFIELKRLTEFGIEEVDKGTIDFAVYSTSQNSLIQSDYYFEVELLKLAGELSFGIEITQYFPEESEEE